MERVINKRLPNSSNNQRKLKNTQEFRKIAGNKENIPKNNGNFDLLHYLTSSNSGTSKQSSFDRLSEKSTNQSMKIGSNIEKKPSFDYLEWLCTPEKSENIGQENDRNDDTNSLNLSLDSFMQSLMNPVIQSQHNISVNDFDDVMNTFLSSRSSNEFERDKTVFEIPSICRSLFKNTKNDRSTLSKNNVRDTRIGQKSRSNSTLDSHNLLQTRLRSHSRLNNNPIFDIPIFPQNNSKQESSISQKTKRRIVQESKNPPKRKCQNERIYPGISLKNILIPDFESNLVVKFNTNWISCIASIKWLESSIKESVTNEKKLIKNNIFICNFQNKSNEQSVKIHRVHKGKLKIYKLHGYLIEKKTNQDLDADSLLQLLSQNENIKIESQIVQNSSFNLNDSQISEVSVDSVLSRSQQTLRNGLNQICQNHNTGGNDQCKDLNSVGKLMVLSRIQQIFIKVFEALQNNQIPCLNVRHREYRNCVFKDNLLQLKPVGQASSKIINYNAKHSHFKFCLILYLLAKIYQLVEHNTKLTKREIFYQMKPLIKNQTQINTAIDEISCLLDVGIWKLNLVSQKGLVYGDLKVTFSSGETLDCNVPGTLIPFNVDEIIEIRSRVYFILIVEKESIFHKLIEENLPNKMTRPFLMITGKGYPNLFTQLFVNKLWRIMSVPVFILVDPDPSGIHIMLNYRFGSLNNSHVSQDLAIPKAKWLGVFPSEIIKLGIKTTPLSRRDIKVIQNLIASPYMNDNPRIKKELEVLLEKNLKASIEGLIKTNKFLSSSYLPTKFVNRDLI